MNAENQQPRPKRTLLNITNDMRYAPPQDNRFKTNPGGHKSTYSSYNTSANMPYARPPPLMHYSVNSPSPSYHSNTNRISRFDQNYDSSKHQFNRVQKSASFKPGDKSTSNTKVQHQLEKSKELIRNEVIREESPRPALNSNSHVAAESSATRHTNCNVYEDLDWNDDNDKVTQQLPPKTAQTETKTNLSDSNNQQPETLVVSESTAVKLSENTAPINSPIVIVSGMLREEINENCPSQSDQDCVTFSIKFFFCKKCAILMGDDTQLSNHLSLQSHLDSAKS
jgi:hypothetical protein